MRGSTMSIIMEAAKRERASAWVKLMAEIVPLFRDGDTLSRIEAGWLAEWLNDIGRTDLKPEDVQTVQIPRDWAADVLGGYSMSASRALRAMQVAGILTLIRKGQKGHASLYCVNPLPEAAGDALTGHE